MDSPIKLPHTQSSYWLENATSATYPKVTGDLECDVVIVGGGIAGLSVAYTLKKSGLKVIVLEKNTVASGTTGGTTGKLTTQHGIIYEKLIKQFGKPNAQVYATASQNAFNTMTSLIHDQNIDCDFRIEDNYVYTANPKKVKQFQDEANAAVQLGLPAEYVTNLSLPFETIGAVKFANQAMINAQKYTAGLAKLVNGEGSYVFEHSNVVRIHHGKPCKISTKSGTVTATNIIIATKVPAAPLAGRMTYAAIEYPLTSYIVAGKYTGDLSGMYISPDKEHYSLLPVRSNGTSLLLVGGEGHVTGLRTPQPNQQKLANYAHKWFDINDIEYRWKAMDYVAYDNLPVVGKLYPWSDNMYVIGGLKKWGLNLSMVAAILINDLVHNVENPAAKLFSPHRLSAPASIPLAIMRSFKH